MNIFCLKGIFVVGYLDLPKISRRTSREFSRIRIIQLPVHLVLLLLSKLHGILDNSLLVSINF